MHTLDMVVDADTTVAADGLQYRVVVVDKKVLFLIDYVLKHG